MRPARILLAVTLSLAAAPGFGTALAAVPEMGAVGPISPPMNFRWAPVAGSHNKQYFEGNVSVDDGTVVHITYFMKQGDGWKVLKNKSAKVKNTAFDVAFGLGIHKGKCGTGASLGQVQQPSLRFKCGKNLE